MYSYLIESVNELLVRMQYQWVYKNEVMLNGNKADKIIGNKFKNFTDMIKHFSNQKVWIYHLSKMAGASEIRELYEESDVSVEDHLTMHNRITESKGAFLPDDLPFLFLYMDSDLMFENSLKTLYSEE